MGGYKLRENAQKWLTDSAQELEDSERQELKDTIAKQGEQIAMLLAAGGHTDTPAPESLASDLDDADPEVPEVIEPAVKVAAAPAARPKRKARAKK
jgi:dsDNA-binding SOS-regulon protein